MRKNSVKNIRINGEVQKALSEIIRSDLKDPRIHPMTSVVQVSVTPDLKICKAYISVLADEEQAKDTIRGLKSAEGFIRTQLAKKINLRMSKLIDEVTKDLPDEDDKEENDDQ